MGRVFVMLTQPKVDRADRKAGERAKSGELTPSVRLDSRVQSITDLYNELQWI